MPRERSRIPVPFGGGLDRETGIMVAPPTTMDDLRNVLLHQGKYLVRRGFKARIELNDGTNDMTHVLGGHALRSLRASVYVGYNQTTGEVQVFRGDSFGEAATFVDTWFSLSAGADPPVISMAESYGKVFLAHDDPIITTRASTYSYDLASDTLAVVQADLDGGGNADLKFRGVTRHLEYLVGWGYGSASENRPELVRISQPGDPTDFQPEWYFIIGDRNDPVTRCTPVGGTLACFKESETYELFGSGRSNFGVRMLDPQYGLPVSRACVNVSGLLFAWTNEGPRLYDGSYGSDSLELPLELPQPEPSDLVTEGEAKYSFAEYLPTYRVVLFVFGQRVYALTTRVRGDWKWSYWELGFTALCGFRLPGTAGGLQTAPTGFPDNLSVANETTSSFDLTWDNNSQDADEFLEVWLKPTGESWYHHSTYAVSGGLSQTKTIEGLDPGTNHEVWVRYRRGTLYADDYQGTNPEDWDAQSYLATATTTLSAMTDPTLSWERTSATVERIGITFTPVHPGVPVEVRLGTTTIATVTVTGETTVYDTLTGGSGGEFTPEAYNNYTVRHVTVDATGTASSIVSQWGGPDNPPTGVTATSVVAEEYDVTWTNGDPSLATEVWDDWTRPDGPVGTFPVQLAATKSAGVSSHEDEALGSMSPTNDVMVGVRHKQTLFGVDDYSDFGSDTVTIS